MFKNISECVQGIARKRWRVALFMATAFKSTSKNEPLLLPRSVVVDIEPESINTAMPSEIIPDKKLEVVGNQFNGVKGDALALTTDPEMGIQGGTEEPLLSPRSDVVNIGPESINTAILSEIIPDKTLEVPVNQFNGVKGDASALITDIKNGIQGGPEELAKRRQLYGSNIFKRPPPKTWKMVLENFYEPLIILLTLCATFALGYGIHKYGLEGWREGGIILVAIFLVVGVTTMSKVWSRRQLYQVSRSFDAIPIEVKREGQVQKISLHDAVVGDIIVLKTGYQVPADGLCVRGRLKVDESSISTEVDPIEVDSEHNPFLLSGTVVVNGSGEMIVTAVGMNTKRGKMMSMKQSDSPEKTKLYVKLHRVTKLIALAGLTTSVLSLLVLVSRYFTGHMRHANGVSLHNVIVGLLATPIAIAAASRPEGLLLAVTITLGYSVKRLAAKSVFVRNHTACEAIGAVTVICTSITGPTTSKNPEVIKVWLGPKLIGEEEMPLSKRGSEIEEMLRVIIPSNNSTPFENMSNINSELTEKAIDESYAHIIGMDIKQLIETFCQEAETSNKEIAGGSVLIHKKVDDTIHLLKRGAPMSILNECPYHFDKNREIKDIDDHIREKLVQIIQNIETCCFHCVAFAHKSVTCLSDHEDITFDFDSIREKHEDENFTLLGFVGLIIPCNLEEKQAMIDCGLAGVDVKMITKENLNAAQCGIVDVSQQEVIVDGEKFRSYSRNERLAKADKIRVVVRATTLDKNLMVTTLKEKSHVVAFIGESISDSRALREADVGISLGTEGADIVKESSDIVILDDRFESVMDILRWGRCIYPNIQIFTQYQITAIIVSLVIDFVTAISASAPPTINIVAAISSGKVPYATVQVLWLRLIVSLLAALALTIEQPTEELVQQRPVNWKQPFITSRMWRDIVVQALYQITVLLTTQFTGESTFSLNSGEKDTMIFNILVLCQIFLIFNTRKSEKNFFKTLQRRKLFWATIGTIALLQLMLIELLNRVSKTERLNWRQWAVCIGLSSLSWPIG